MLDHKPRSQRYLVTRSKRDLSGRSYVDLKSKSSNAITFMSFTLCFFQKKNFWYLSKENKISCFQILLISRWNSIKISVEIPLRSRPRFTNDLGARSRNGINRAPRSSRDLTARSFENQLMVCSIQENNIIMSNLVLNFLLNST